MPTSICIIEDGTIRARVGTKQCSVYSRRPRNSTFVGCTSFPAVALASMAGSRESQDTIYAQISIADAFRRSEAVLEIVSTATTSADASANTPEDKAAEHWIST